MITPWHTYVEYGRFVVTMGSALALALHLSLGSWWGIRARRRCITRIGRGPR
jgi:hypothetical protein